MWLLGCFRVTRYDLLGYHDALQFDEFPNPSLNLVIYRPTWVHERGHRDPSFNPFQAGIIGERCLLTNQ
jgi:hypothetical protein